MQSSLFDGVAPMLYYLASDLDTERNVKHRQHKTFQIIKKNGNYRFVTNNKETADKFKNNNKFTTQKQQKRIRTTRPIHTQNTFTIIATTTFIR